MFPSMQKARIFLPSIQHAPKLLLQGFQGLKVTSTANNVYQVCLMVHLFPFFTITLLQGVKLLIYVKISLFMRSYASGGLALTVNLNAN